MMLRNRQLYRSNPNMISRYQRFMQLDLQGKNPTSCFCFLLKTS